MGPGQESGQEVDWGWYVGHFRSETGGFTKLADELVRRAAGVVDAPSDVASVEKGLRRLATRKQKPGGDYGRWMIRFFGMPANAERWVRWISQYHTRFADLPSSLRLEQLRLWDRPPVSESRLSTWIDLGLASVFFRLGDLPHTAMRLERASQKATLAGADAEMEAKLFEARLATDRGDRATALVLFDEVEALLPSSSNRIDRLCYHARLVGQRAYHLTKPPPGEAEQNEAALLLFQSIEDTPDLPFVSYRKTSGLAWCTWRLGDRAEGARLARLAATYAGDGGLVRFRVMALRMLARMVDDGEAEVIRARARHLARQLEDENLHIDSPRDPRVGADDVDGS